MSSGRSDITGRRASLKHQLLRPSLDKLQHQLNSKGKSVIQKLFDDRDSQRALYNDEVFSLEDWRRAKSWHRHLPSRDGLKLMSGFSWLVVYCFIMSMCVCCYHFWLEPLGAPGWADNDADVWQVFNLTSFALALLLVFRTNSSYGRWWEARILWGSQINLTRDIVRRAISWFPDDCEDLLLMFARWSILMSHGLKISLRGEAPVAELQRFLPERELRWAARSSHLPTTIAQVLSEILALVDMPEFHRVTLDANLNRYVDILGSCERILKTPIHRNWTTHTSRFVLVWLTFLPFPLWPVYGWATPGITVIVAWLLLGIENIGVQIEEPFAVLALDAYCNVCERSVQDLMSQRKGAVALIKRTRLADALSRINSLGGHAGLECIGSDSSADAPAAGSADAESQGGGSSSGAAADGLSGQPGVETISSARTVQLQPARETHALGGTV